jgi:hypothetical protein
MKIKLDIVKRGIWLAKVRLILLIEFLKLWTMFSFKFGLQISYNLVYQMHVIITCIFWNISYIFFFLLDNNNGKGKNGKWSMKVFFCTLDSHIGHEIKRSVNASKTMMRSSPFSKYARIRILALLKTLVADQEKGKKNITNNFIYSRNNGSIGTEIRIVNSRDN